MVRGRVDELAREVESLQGELEEARARALGHGTALAELEERRTETKDDLELARKQITDLAKQIELRQTELEEARQQALYDTFVEALALRDAASHDAAVQLEAALEALTALEQRREEVAAAFASVSPRFEAEVPDELGELDEAWAKVVALVRADLDQKLEDELVYAAATSPGGQAIQELPAHLREVASRKRRELQKRNRHALRRTSTS